MNRKLKTSRARKSANHSNHVSQKQAVKFVNMSVRQNLNRVRQGSGYYKFGFKKTHVVFEQLDLNFQ